HPCHRRTFNHRFQFFKGNASCSSPEATIWIYINSRGVTQSLGRIDYSVANKSWCFNFVNMNIGYAYANLTLESIFLEQLKDMIPLSFFLIYSQIPCVSVCKF